MTIHKYVHRRFYKSSNISNTDLGIYILAYFLYRYAQNRGAVIFRLIKSDKNLINNINIDLLYISSLLSPDGGVYIYIYIYIKETRALGA